MKALACIIAGGKSSRMNGQEKAFLDLGGKPMLQHVIERVAPQVQAVAINANGDPSRFSQFGLPVLADNPAEVSTPLAGLLTALTYAAARDFGLVLSLPSDTPFLPPDLRARLGEGSLPALAASAGQTHFLTGLWPAGVATRIAQEVNRHGLRRMQDVAKRLAARTVQWTADPHDPFFNINTPEDLAKAQRLLQL